MLLQFFHFYAFMRLRFYVLKYFSKKEKHFCAFPSIAHKADFWQAVFVQFSRPNNEKVNSTHRPPCRFYFCTVDIFSFTPFMVCLDLLLTAMEGVYYE